MRYFDLEKRTEAIQGVHFNGETPPDGIIPLDEDNVFFKIIPKGQQLAYDAEGLPSGFEDIPPQELTPRQVRDQALASLTHDFGDGRVMQTRPKDEQNIRNAIEIMEANTIPSIGWVMVDDKKYDVTVEELKTALTAGQLAAVQVWNNYNPEG